MKFIRSKKIILAIITVFLLTIAAIMYNQTTMEKLFYNTDVSKTSEESLKFRFKLSAFLHQYDFSDRHGDLLLYNKKRISNTSLSYSPKLHLALHNDSQKDRTSKFTEDNLKYIYEGVTYESAVDTLGTPTDIFKDVRDNHISMVTWSSARKSRENKSITLMFDDKGECFNMSKHNVE
ncbi:hypothetical protein [Candidatus Enterococcus mansonii]|uniref:Uncharacterized protein n=1 Tax=Candidatus Enterococcus mansonii TaxID=1834181 RepID=A0A242CHN3_9ENTE|nr:hypothetical protein [Enterococcus sp. 4G2_DIV0659]OTO09638.1 hypothetical protein A5880_000317 [Enterococcus sp. 4G2_DIV0659]